jgi:hypothetical protein
VLNVVSVYSRLKNITDGETMPISWKEPVVGQSTGDSGSEHSERKRRRWPTY